MRAVADAVKAHKVPKLVVDPVLVATSGDALAGSEVAQALKAHLFPLATLITPNLPEASALLGSRRVSDLDSMKQVRASAGSASAYPSERLFVRPQLCEPAGICDRLEDEPALSGLLSPPSVCCGLSCV